MCRLSTTVSASSGVWLKISAVVLRDTAEVFSHTPLDADTVVEQARSILEDVTIAAWKVGFLGSAEGVSAVAEVLSDYPDVPLVAYMPNLSWIEDDDQQEYLDAFRELVLPQTELLVGNHQTLTDFLLPEWDADRPASPRELAVAAAEHGTRFVLVTGVNLPNQFIDNVLASSQGALTGEKFERFEAAFVGAGDTLAAALAALLASGTELHDAVGEALDLPRPGARRGLPPGHGQRAAGPLLLGPAGRRGRGGRGRAERGRGRCAVRRDAARALIERRPWPPSHRTRHDQRTALRARPARHPGRRQFAGARLSRRRRHAALHRPRRGRVLWDADGRATSTTSAPGAR